MSPEGERVCLVTGASRGIGRATAERLLGQTLDDWRRVPELDLTNVFVLVQAHRDRHDRRLEKWCRGEASEWIPARRWGAPEDVAAAIAWLLSDEASYVTGAVLPVDGGDLAR